MAPRVSSRAQPPLLDEVALLLLVVRGADRGHQVAHPAGRSPQREHDCEHRTDARPGRLGRGQGDLVGDQLAGILRQARDRVDLVGDLLRVHDQAVDQHHRHQQREDGEEAVERHPGRQQWHLVGLGLGEAALDDLEPALGRDLGRFVGLSAGNFLLHLLSVQLIGSTHEHSVPNFAVNRPTLDVPYLVSHTLAKDARSTSSAVQSHRSPRASNRRATAVMDPPTRTRAATSATSGCGCCARTEPSPTPTTRPGRRGAVLPEPADDAAQHLVGQPAVELGDRSLAEQRLDRRDDQCATPLAGVGQTGRGRAVHRERTTVTRPPASPGRARPIAVGSDRSRVGWSGGTDDAAVGASPGHGRRAALDQGTDTETLDGGNGHGTS